MLPKKGKQFAPIPYPVNLNIFLLGLGVNQHKFMGEKIKEIIRNLYNISILSYVKNDDLMN